MYSTILVPLDTAVVFNVNVVVSGGNGEKPQLFSQCVAGSDSLTNVCAIWCGTWSGHSVLPLYKRLFLCFLALSLFFTSEVWLFTHNSSMKTTSCQTSPDGCT